MLKSAKEKPMISVLQIKDLILKFNYFADGECLPWTEKGRKVPFIFPIYYYKIESDKIIVIVCTSRSINYGTKFIEQIESYYVAYRDGKTEYSIFDNRIRQTEKRLNTKTTERTRQRLEEIKKVRNKLIPFSSSQIAKKKEFKSFLKKTDYVSLNAPLSEKYVVLDVETNGLRAKKDDLLSVSIYDPSTGYCYERFLPLDLQPVVSTTEINGITESSLKNTSHISQEEIDELLSYFSLKDRVILSYSGGKGLFDKNFLLSYCKRHDLKGFENLRYQNIKQDFTQAGASMCGSMTKDNLCKLFGIDGISKIHNSTNDCVLEWKLFERISGNRLFFLGNKLYEFDDDYIVPITYLLNSPCLEKMANIKLKKLKESHKEIYSYEFDEKAVKKLKKFDTNINGIAIEHAIDFMLKAHKQDNSAFLIKNKSKIRYIGCIKESVIEEIPIIEDDNGFLAPIDSADKETVKEINENTAIIIRELKECVDFIKENIFNCSRIMSQELVFSNDRRTLALCDLSNEESVIEIKTYDVLRRNGEIEDRILEQLFYEKNGRKTYLMSIMLEGCTFYEQLKSITIKIYSVDMVESDD